MNPSPVYLKEVDRVEIITLIDNYVDVLLENTDTVTRPKLSKGEEIETDTLVAEHGLSLLVTIHQNGKKHTILFDTGYTQIGVPHNIERLDIDINEIEMIVMSHGHMDHTGSLYPLLDKMSKPITLAVHPDDFHFPRYKKLDDGKKIRFPQTLKREELKEKRVDVLETKSPTSILEDLVMITGEVERTTPFEKGLPNALLERNGNLEEDPISDDQSLAIHLRSKGLVVISGCSHAGIVNTVLFSRKASGVEKVHALIGGFHLTGAIFEPIIETTISELKKIDPKVLVPMHCTGWKAVQRFAEAFPTAFILNSVGSKITLTS